MTNASCDETESMSKSTNWKDIAELIGIAAIVVSLIVVAVELRQSTKELQFATLDSTLGYYNNWRAKIIENDDVTEIWRTGIAGAQLTPNQAVRFRLLLAELMYVNQSAYVRIMNDASYSEGQADTMRKTIAQLMKNDAVLNRWRDNQFGSAYNQEFIDFVDSIVLEQ